jgi:hypothetical protein
MGTFQLMLSLFIEELRGRAGGPLTFRLVIMPTVVTILAVRAGLKDARDGHPAFLWAVLAKPTERAWALRSASKDLARVFLMAVIMDTIYQIMVLRGFYILQLLVVAVVCAIVPYVLIRGPVTRIARGLSRKKAS